MADFYTLCYGDTSTVVTMPLSVRNCGETDLATGANDHNMYYPLTTNYKYSYSQSVYPAKVCYDIDTIRGLALHRTLTGGALNRTLSIWMADTTAATLASAVSTTGMTCVANNVSFLFKAQEWDTLMFTTPFVHDGSSNLVLTIVDATGTDLGASQCPRWFWHEGDGQVRYDYNDNSTFNAANPSGISHTAEKLADIRFVAECAENFSCVAPVAAIDSIGSTAFKVVWDGGYGSSWSVEYRTAGSNVWNVAAVTAQSSCTITGLTPALIYEVRVGVVCETETRYSDAVTVTTACDDIHLPFHFTNTDMGAAVDNHGLAPCWNFSQYFYLTRVTSSSIPAVWNAGNGEWFMLPAIAEPLTNAHLRTWVATSTDASVMVGVASQSDCSDVVWIDTVPIPGGSVSSSHHE